MDPSNPFAVEAIFKARMNLVLVACMWSSQPQKWPKGMVKGVETVASFSWGSTRFKFLILITTQPTLTDSAVLFTVELNP